MTLSLCQWPYVVGDLWDPVAQAPSLPELDALRISLVCDMLSLSLDCYWPSDLLTVMPHLQHSVQVAMHMLIT